MSPWRNAGRWLPLFCSSITHAVLGLVAWFVCERPLLRVILDKRGEVTGAQTHHILKRKDIIRRNCSTTSYQYNAIGFLAPDVSFLLNTINRFLEAYRSVTNSRRILQFPLFSGDQVPVRVTHSERAGGDNREGARNVSQNQENWFTDRPHFSPPFMFAFIWKIYKYLSLTVTISQRAGWFSILCTDEILVVGSSMCVSREVCHSGDIVALASIAWWQSGLIPARRVRAYTQYTPTHSSPYSLLHTPSLFSRSCGRAVFDIIIGPWPNQRKGLYLQ